MTVSQQSRLKLGGGEKTSFMKSVSSVECFSVVHLPADSILISTAVYKGNLHNSLHITCVCDPKMYFCSSGFFLCFYFSCVLGSEQCQRRWSPGHFKPLGEARTKTQNPKNLRGELTKAVKFCQRILSLFRTLTVGKLFEKVCFDGLQSKDFTFQNLRLSSAFIRQAVLLFFSKPQCTLSARAALKVSVCFSQSSCWIHIQHNRQSSIHICLA